MNTPLYVSAPTKYNFGNTYAIYADRIELHCRFPFFSKLLAIQAEDLISIATYPPPVFRTTIWALKLDLADLKEHVGIRRRTGFFKQLRFTPDNPHLFVAKAIAIFNLPDGQSR